MSLDTDIRGALYARLAGVSGIPADIVHETRTYRPVPDTAFVTADVLFASSRPATMGDAHLVAHEGTFEVVLVYPVRGGTGPVEEMGNAVKDHFKASDTATLGSNTVRFRYAERRKLIPDGEWVRLPISVGWYLHSPQY